MTLTYDIMTKTYMGYTILLQIFFFCLKRLIFLEFFKISFILKELAIMFAGEATLKNYHSTVHGAFVSGQREAQRILDDLED